MLSHAPKWTGGYQMEHTYYKIGEVSQVTGISKDTLHFYNKIGLLVPDHIDPDNQYRYYSLRNLWQLDIITTCRKLNIPLETVRQILALRDNEEIARLLMEYRQEAVRLSRYYQQVAEDILWYGEEKERIARQKDRTAIQEKRLDEEIVIAGRFSRDAQSYHASLQEAAKEALRHAPSIRRKYGYILDLDGLARGKFISWSIWSRPLSPRRLFIGYRPENTSCSPCRSGMRRPTFPLFWTGWRNTIKR